MTHSKRELLALFDEYGIKPKRSLGQNFVVDANIVRKIASVASLSAEDHVVEVGAGAGSLSLALLETGANLTCIELDDGLLSLLHNEIEPKGVRIFAGDVMKLDWNEILGSSNEWTLVANLPYNIATPLVCDLLDSEPRIKKMIVMVQQEAAERFVAPVGGGDYGGATVKINYWAEAKIAFRVSPSVFVPRPRVDSAVVVIERRPAVIPDSIRDPDPDTVPAEFLFSLVYKAFNQRRKQLQRSLREVAIEEDFAQSDVKPSARPQELDVGQWTKFATCIYKRTQN